MKNIIYLLLLTGIVSCGTSSSSNETEANKLELMNQLFEDYKDFQFYTYPEYASYEGNNSYSNRLTDQSIEAGDIYMDSIEAFKASLIEIDKTKFGEKDQLNYDMFLFSLNESIDQNNLKIGNYLNFTQQGGFHIYIPQIVGYQPIETKKDIENYISRLQQFKIECGHVIENLKEGQAKGIVLPCNITTQVLDQLKELANTPAEESPFYSIYEKNEILKADPTPLKKVIEEFVVSGYQELYSYFKDEYHPNCREKIGISAVDGGKEYYQFLVRKYTTSKITPEAIFEIGENEVARIAAEMSLVQNELGYGDVSKEKFFAELRTNPKFYFTEKEDLINGFRNILTNMDSKLPDLFGTLPKTPYDLKEIEEYRAAAAPAAYYYSAPADGSRPGYFYVNTYKLDSRPKYTMTALALHEAVPGHHLQIALAKELENVPWFRKQMQVTAFVEGWGLYAEYLGYETNMYEDPVQKMGALSFEMWRACRLVVDVGLHYKGWTRDEAVVFMKSNAPLSDLDLQSEIDRYIAWPGQALAYKTGELKFKALREKATIALGDKFDVKKFHDILLENGSIPMGLLEENVNKWIESYN